MYAIVEIAGQQFKVEKDQRLFVHQLKGEAGDTVEFSDVYLIEDNGAVTVGAPAVEGALVTAKIEEHLKGEKVIVFKKKRRKGYKKKNGHRQRLTKITIESIVASGAKKAAKKADAKPAAKKAAPKAKAAKGDDLTKIEGVGPKIAEVLTAAGLATFADVAKSTPEAIKEILSAHSRLASKNPSTWCQQAELAAEGKWDELKKWQDELDGGKA
ncbi:MAG: 50S ribosomal protein L21 [Flavobacteriales bacterium]|jgi:large subunit ribosomal protein L21|nr:50S ribosomal protein L21 [Flavobacteriales bacterium]